MFFRKRVQVNCGTESRTKQQVAGATDINQIMARFEQTGVHNPQNLNQRQKAFLDVSEIGDLRTVLERVRIAEEEFLKLPAKTRAYFKNDPVQLVEFVQDAKNYSIAKELGLLKTMPDLPVPPLDNTGRSDTTSVQSPNPEGTK